MSHMPYDLSVYTECVCCVVVDECVILLGYQQWIAIVLVMMRKDWFHASEPLGLEIN